MQLQRALEEDEAVCQAAARVEVAEKMREHEPKLLMEQGG